MNNLKQEFQVDWQFCSFYLISPTLGQLSSALWLSGVVGSERKENVVETWSMPTVLCGPWLWELLVHCTISHTHVPLVKAWRDYFED